ncbi:MAG: ABC transporter substrate-binding protein [Bifidobacteriaceae bacterium]|jgi:oligopeptide transport system substrate-binding protein|nr:ABC transporter substrate-binding protein [Bifidobacteriaceae bacterium]
MIHKPSRLAAITVAALTALSLAACGGKKADNDASSAPAGDAQSAEQSAPAADQPASDTPFQIAYNADAAHEPWVTAVTNSIAQTLGINATGNPYPTFKEFRDAITKREIQTAFRTGWQADYPGLNNFLGPLYYTKAGSNDGDYSTTEFDDLINQANNAKSVDEANSLLQQAQTVLFTDLPAIPLWYQNVTGVWGEKVENVVFNWKSVPIYNEVTKTEDGGIVTANAGEPQNPLIPSLTNEVQGGKVLDLIFSGLVYYDGSGAVHNEVAESITTDDSKTYTIKVADGWTFSDGSKVNADSFINAWDDGALLSNERLSSYFFEGIEGFSYDEDTHIKDAGLKKVDDLTFTVTLKQAEADFPLRLGYSAFAPLPESAFDKDGKVTDEFGEHPIGNGPYQLDGDNAWKHEESIALVPNPNYKGQQKVSNNGTTLIFYPEMDAAYADVQAGNLDILDAMPESGLPTYQTDFAGRYVNQPAAVFQSFTIPQWLDHFQGDEGKLRRQAISMAINRAEICDKIFSGTRSPASDFTSPVISGWSDSVPGSEVLQYNPEKAKELWEQANQINPW